MRSETYRSLSVISSYYLAGFAWTGLVPLFPRYPPFVFTSVLLRRGPLIIRWVWEWLVSSFYWFWGYVRFIRIFILIMDL